ncbi:hypothetical protein HUJ05_004033 [Dendroctonus ponderosae]|nr:hypothetical protein HUJ05_004033 [Dendroctonus ponderosae]
MVLSIERFVGKVAVVTGASSGIGAGIVEALVSNGLIVAGLGRRVEAIESLAQKLAGSKGKLIAFKCDMTKEDEIVSTLQQIISKLGPISVLINNAGLSRTGSLINGDPKSWKTVLETNVLGLCIATKQAIQNMIANQTLGHIIHINSVVGHTVMNIPGFDMYGPSKYAVTALAETLRLEINREKLQIKITNDVTWTVTVLQSVSPGYVKTNFEFPINVDNMLGLESEDVADAVIYALSTPPHGLTGDQPKIIYLKLRRKRHTELNINIKMKTKISVRLPMECQPKLTQSYAAGKCKSITYLLLTFALTEYSLTAFWFSKMVLSIERFVGKVAVVTGASSGIGAGIAEALVSNGLIVAGLGRRVEAIEALAQKLAGAKGKLIAFECDITKEDEIVSTFEQIISKLGPISVLINNAGLSQRGSLINGDPKSWKTILKTNVLGLCIATKQAIQNMIANQTLGHIIHINSVVGHAVMDLPGFDMYGPSKYAVTALAETLRLEINREKLQIKITNDVTWTVTVLQSVSPGYVKTNFEFASGIENFPGLDIEDVADAVVYALSTAPHFYYSKADGLMDNVVFYSWLTSDHFPIVEDSHEARVWRKILYFSLEFLYLNNNDKME